MSRPSLWPTRHIIYTSKCDILSPLYKYHLRIAYIERLYSWIVRYNWRHSVVWNNCWPRLSLSAVFPFFANAPWSIRILDTTLRKRQSTISLFIIIQSIEIIGCHHHQHVPPRRRQHYLAHPHHHNTRRSTGIEMRMVMTTMMMRITISLLLLLLPLLLQIATTTIVTKVGESL